MRRDVDELRAFYASPLGRTAREMIGRKLVEAWGDARGLDVLGVGYPTPYLESWRAEARRVVAAMPAGQGVELWPTDARVAAALTPEGQLPFRQALFDRVLLVHALEEADDPAALLRAAVRVLAPSGRLLVVACARAGVWGQAEATPFGHGRPYTRGQLERLVREAGLEPTAWSRALYVPPAGWLTPLADGFEQAGSLLWPKLAGVVLLEAIKQTFAVRPRGAVAPARTYRPGVLAPVPVGAGTRTPG